MSAPEFSHRIALERLGTRPLEQNLVAGPEAREALARRFDLIAIERLEARLSAVRQGPGAAIEGRFVADVVQRCVVSGEPVPAHVAEAIALRFEPLAAVADEVELDADALDVLPVEDGAIDLGEAVAQSLPLALDPYPRAPDAVLADARRLLTSEEEAASAESAARAEASPFARLKRP
jgi:uncharacterized metal-binding protein YceD (DUF177 family)